MSRKYREKKYGKALADVLNTKKLNWKTSICLPIWATKSAAKSKNVNISNFSIILALRGQQKAVEDAAKTSETEKYGEKNIKIFW